MSKDCRNILVLIAMPVRAWVAALPRGSCSVVPMPTQCTFVGEHIDDRDDCVRIPIMMTSGRRLPLACNYMDPCSTWYCTIL